MRPSLQERTNAFRTIANQQPGCTPYDNHRPIYVRKHSAGQPLAELLRRIDPYSTDAKQMEAHLSKGWIQRDKKRPHLDQVLVAGNTIDLVIPNTVGRVLVLNSCTSKTPTSWWYINRLHCPFTPAGASKVHLLLARIAWPDVTIRPVHRLDANTTGVIVFAKTVPAARWLVTEFHEHRVEKTYVLEVHGIPKTKHLSPSPQPSKPHHPKPAHANCIKTEDQQLLMYVYGAHSKTGPQYSTWRQRQVVPTRYASIFIAWACRSLAMPPTEPCLIQHMD